MKIALRHGAKNISLFGSVARRVLIFLHSPGEIARDREGLSGTEIVEVVGKDLGIIDWFVALSRRVSCRGLATEKETLISTGLLRERSPQTALAAVIKLTNSGVE